MAKITDAGLALMAQLQADEDTLIIDKMVYANIDGLDYTQPPPGTETLPDVGDIVRESDISDTGYVDPNTVVYSDTLTPEIGDFAFNWIGLYCSEFTTLVAVTYVPLQYKRATEGFNIGNTICKNFALNYTELQDLTGITIEAATWQQDVSDLYEPLGAVADHEAAADPHPQYNTGDGVPVGSILPFSSETVPAGYLECDGAAISRTTYADLFTAIGTLYGVGDGSTTFNIPDFRGYFLRGWDHGAGIDPDAATRTDSGDGSTTGDHVGTKQADAFESHAHTGVFPVVQTDGDTGDGMYGRQQYSSSTPGSSVNSTGGNETRPKNTNVMYCIKAYASVVNSGVIDFQDVADEINAIYENLATMEEGILLSNNATDSEHDLDLAPGVVRSADKLATIVLDSVLTKKIDGNWTAGNNAGGFPSGLTLTADTWYHVFAIYNPTTEAVDAGFDTSQTAVNLLSDANGYTKFRRLGSILTDGSGDVEPFKQVKDYFSFINIYQEYSGTSSGLITVRCPSNIEAYGHFKATITDANNVKIYDTDDLSRSSDAGVAYYADTAGNYFGELFSLMITGGKINLISSRNIDISTLGYRDLSL